MRNFQKIMSLQVGDLLHAVQRQPELWNAQKLRTSHPMTPHKEVDDIWIRFNDLREVEKHKEAGHDAAAIAAVIDEHENIWQPATAQLPSARLLALQLFSAVQGDRLGRVLITRLRPGGRIDPHVDGGAHAAYYDRYHIVLQSLAGSIFMCGEEVVSMNAGEVWWFDNKVTHSVVNNSTDDRLHLIVDIHHGRVVWEQPEC